MHPRIQELVNYLISARTHLDHAVESVPAERRDTQPGADRWSVANVLQHLALANAGMARVFEKRAAAAREDGIGADPGTTSILWTMDVHSLLDRRTRIETPVPIPPGDEALADDARRMFDDAHRRLTDAIVAAGDVACDRISHPHPVLGPLNLYQWGIFAAAHEIRHAAQIREIGAQLAVSAA